MVDTKSIQQEEKWVREFLIPEIIDNGKLLNDDTSVKQINKDKFTLRDITIAFLNTKEAFMLTKCYRVKIDYEYDDNKKSTTLMVKKTPQLSRESYDNVGFDALFHNEILAYTKIIPDIIEKKKFAKYYNSYRKENEAVVVLGDFTLDGWKMSKAKYNLSLEHVLLAVQYLGEFHGSGFALKHNDKQKFQQIVESFKEARFNHEPNGDWRVIMTKGPERAINAAKTFQYSEKPIPNEFLEKLQNLIPSVHIYCAKCCIPIEPISTICHGDYLRNNIAYKYDDKDPDKPTDIIMFDFQTLRYATPMIDLTLFLSISCGKDVRSQNFDKIFDTYWNALVQKYCKQTGIELKDLPAYLSHDALLKEYIRCSPYGLAIASCFFMAIVDPDNYDVDDMLEGNDRPYEDVVQDSLTRGGDIVDKELSALIHDLYERSTKYNVDIFKGFL